MKKICLYCRTTCWHNAMKRANGGKGEQEYRCTNCGYPCSKRTMNEALRQLEVSFADRKRLQATLR